MKNTRIALESLCNLAKNNMSLVSITENIDYSTAQGRLMTTMLAGFAEYFSDSLATHIKKGVRERAMQGKHLGGIPFGYECCWEGPKGDRHLRCVPEHPGSLHPVEPETEAVRELFRRYATGTTTLRQLAIWLNSQGLRTRNTKRIADGSGILQGGPRLFTTSYVRGILHNPFYYGKVKHLDQLLPGAQDTLVSEELFQTVQSAMKRNSGRSSTLTKNPEREYLLKGLIRCAYCLLPMWAQTYKNSNRYYREHKGSRGAGYCVTVAVPSLAMLPISRCPIW
jgi:hypothetical protein